MKTCKIMTRAARGVKTTLKLVEQYLRDHMSKQSDTYICGDDLYIMNKTKAPAECTCHLINTHIRTKNITTGTIFQKAMQITKYRSISSHHATHLKPVRHDIAYEKEQIVINKSKRINRKSDLACKVFAIDDTKKGNYRIYKN